MTHLDAEIFLFLRYLIDVNDIEIGEAGDCDANLIFYERLE